MLDVYAQPIRGMMDRADVIAETQTEPDLDQVRYSTWSSVQLLVY